MFKILEGVTPEYRMELEAAGLLYWRRLSRHTEWRACPRIPEGQRRQTTEPLLSYVVALLYPDIEYAMCLED